MIIDFHTHILPPQVRDNRHDYALRDECFASLYDNPKAKIATAEELVASLDQAGIERAVVVNYGWSTQPLCEETNDYIMEAVARYPKRLSGFGAVQPNAGEAALREIERCAEGDLAGIGELRPDLQQFDLNNIFLMEPLMDALRELDLMLMLHASEPVGHPYPGKGSVTPAKLYPFLLENPELPIILAHWGGGLAFYGLMPEVKRALANVYFDTAASPFLYRPQIYQTVSQIVGADKILLGSDFPLMPQTRLLTEIRGTALSNAEKTAILGDNACALLGL